MFSRKVDECKPLTVGGAGGAAPKYHPISSNQFVEMKLGEMNDQWVKTHEVLIPEDTMTSN
jgi:hypothetical protein